MDQPGNGHFELHMSQQVPNGRGDHRGRAGREGNGRSSSGNNGRSSTGNNGHSQTAHGYSGYFAAHEGSAAHKDRVGHADADQGTRDRARADGDTTDGSTTAAGATLESSTIEDHEGGS